MQKTNVPGIVKASEGVLLNVDAESLANYKKRKLKEQKINRLEEEVVEIKSMLTEVMSILKGINK